MKIHPSCYIVAAIAMIAGSFAFPSRADQSTRPRWEYKILSSAYADEKARTEALNTLGNEGWELTGVSDSHENSTTFTRTVLYFKRPR